MLPYLIFTDLDGTLLDHYDYSFDKAQAALDTIDRHGIPLILNSSKTFAEISEIKAQMQNRHPFIVENGAAVIVPESYFSDGRAESKIIFGPSREDILWRMHLLKGSRHFEFKGFEEFSAEELAEDTGLTLKQAQQAKDRSASEPLKWYGDEASLKLFQQGLAQHGLKLVRGGRFHHVMGHTSKGLAMKWLVEQYQKKYGLDFTVIAAGDSPNDRHMLEEADLAIVIRTVKGECMPLEKEPSKVFNSTKPASIGWQETMNEIFKRINLE